VDIRSYCRFCEALCGIVVTVEGDRVVDVRGDREHPVSHGYTCPKGRSLPQFHHHPDRLDAPQLRVGTELRDVGWDRVMADLADSMARAVADHGPHAVGVYLGTGSAFDPAGRRMGRKLLQALGSHSVYTSASVDAPCKPYVAELMGGQPMLMPLVDEERPGLTLLIGTNPVVSHGHLNAFTNPRTRLRRLAQEGELWVVDPRRTETARLATRHLAPRPATDHLWLGWLVRETLATADMDALRARADGVDELAAAVAHLDLDHVTRVTGLAASDLEDLLASLRRFGGLAGQTGTGCTMAPNANLTEWLLWALHVVTDSFDRPGRAWFNPGFVAGFDRRRREPSDGVAAPGPRSRPELPRRYGEYPGSAMADEIEAGNLRVLFVAGANPVTAFPDADRLASALTRLEALAVLDVVPNETTELATHVLPVAGQLERADLPHFVDQLQPAMVAQYTAAVVPPAASRRPMWRIFAELAAAVGHDLMPGVALAGATDDDALAPLAAGARMTIDELKARDQAVVDEGPVFGWVQDLLPDGRWRLAPEPLLEQFRTLPDPPPSITLIPGRQLRHLNSQLTRSGTEDGHRDDPSLRIHPVDARELGLTAAGKARVVRDGHEVVTTVAIDPDIRRGAVWLPHGFGEANANAVTSDRNDVDPLTGMPVFSGVPVTVTPV
jgi:anaerobic selenocysteine-containing dehydrogenase